MGEEYGEVQLHPKEMMILRPMDCKEAALSHKLTSNLSSPSSVMRGVVSLRGLCPWAEPRRRIPVRPGETALAEEEPPMPCMYCREEQQAM